jgi:phosphoglycolate phosphatase
MKHVNTIIWDWNGTLLNDTDICIETINTLLSDRNLPQIDRKKYLETFGFPVIDYYRRLGFDFSIEPFDIPAMQYIDLYSLKIKECPLHDAAISILSFFKLNGFKQMLLSASEIGLLEASIAHFGIRHYFDGLTGLNNHFAASKSEIGIQMLNDQHIIPSDACLIGDTTHDFEVAERMGCQCVLVANGHQAESKLLETGAQVVGKLEDVKECFKKITSF